MVWVALLAILSVGSLACPQDSYEWEASSICKNYCPTGLHPSNGLCQGASDFLVLALRSSQAGLGVVLHNLEEAQFPYELKEVVLAPSHEGEFWLRAFETDAGCLWTKGSLSLCFTPEHQLQLTVAGRTITGGHVDAMEAVHIQYALRYKEESTTLSLSVDEKQVASETFQGLLFDDSKEEKLRLGDAYQGQMLEVTAYNGVPSNTRRLAACPTNCGRCTREGICVQRCTSGQYWDSTGVCLSCPAACSTGCYRGTDCIQNTDPLCNPSVYASTQALRQSNNCSDCTDYATKSGPKCVCKEGATFSFINYVPTCTCVAPYVADTTGKSCYQEGYYYAQGAASGTFSNDFLSVNFKFSSASSAGGICASIFNAESLAKLGSLPVCLWSADGLTLTVTFGIGATLLHTDVVTFNPDYVQYRPATDTTTKSRTRIVFTSIITLPATLPNPKAVITAPQDYSVSCDDLVISGENSYNNYGRELLYSWTFTASPALPLLERFSTARTTQALVTIPQSWLRPSTITISLKVSTFFATTDTTTRTITITGGQALPVMIEGGDQLTAYKTQEIKVKANIRHECSRNRNVGFYWMFNSALPYTPGLDYKTILNTAPDSSYLLIKPAMLLANFTYWFTAYAYDKSDDTVVGSKSFRLDMPWDQLEIFFDKAAGGTFYYGNDLVIKANATDSDGQLDALSYAWRCIIPETGLPCYNPLVTTGQELLVPATSTLDTITVSAAKLLRNGNYTITLNVKKPSWNQAVYRTLESSLTMRAQNITSPIMTAKVYPTKAVGGRSVVILEGAVASTDPAVYQWSQTAGGVASIISATNLYYLVVRDLSPGTNFVFTLSANLNGTAISTLNFPVVVSSAPQYGSFIAFPSTLFELNQTITLETHNWADSNMPLSYEYSFTYNSESRVIRPLSPMTDLMVALPAGASAVQVVICDALGSCVTRSQNVEVKSLPSKQKAAINIEAEFAFQALDTELVPGLICLYSSAYQLSEYLDNVFLSALTEYYKGLYRKDDTAVNTVLTTLTALVKNIGAANIAQRKAVFELIRVVAVLAEQRLTDAQVLSMHTLASAVTSADSLGEPMAGYEDIDSLLATISRNRGLYQLPYESPLDVTSTTIMARYSRQYGTSFAGASFTLNTATVSFPKDLFSTLSEVQSDSVLDLLVATYPSYTSSQLIASDIVSFTLTLAGSFKGTTVTRLDSPQLLKLDSLESAITITIPRATPDYSSSEFKFLTIYECVYRTPSSKWSKSGCDIIALTSTTVVVNSTHASSFAVQDKEVIDTLSAPVPSILSPGVIVPCDHCGTILTPIWFLIVIFGLAIIFAIFGVIKDKVDARKFGEYDFGVLRTKADQQNMDRALRERPVDPWHITFWKGHLLCGAFWHYRADMSRWARFLIIGVSLIAEECILGVLYWKVKDGPDSGCGRAIFDIYHDMGPTDAFLIFIAIITWTPFTILLVLLFHHLKTFASTTMYGLRVALACVLLFVFFALGTAGVVGLSVEMCAWTSVTWTFSFIYLMIAEVAVTHTALALVRTFLVRCSQTAWRGDAY